MVKVPKYDFICNKKKEETSTGYSQCGVLMQMRDVIMNVNVPISSYILMVVVPKMVQLRVT